MYRMIPTLPTGRDLMRCFDGDSINIASGSYDHATCFHVRLTFAYKLSFSYVRSFGRVFRRRLLYYLMIY